MSSLTATFDECRKQPDGETLLQLRANYFIDIVMNERDCTNAGGLNIPQAGIINGVKERKERERNAKDIAFAVKLMSDRLAQIEANMVDKYGEDFAENLAAEYLDDETYKQLMLIDDKDERRRQIAKVINEGRENGSINFDAINKNPDFKEWLEVHKEKQYLIEAGQSANHSVSSEQKVENTHNSEQRSDLESGLDSFFAKNDTIGI